MSVFSKRINSLRNIIKDKTEALYITDEKNIYYFTGISKSEGVVIITQDTSYLLVDFRYIEYANNKCSSCEVVEAKSFNDDALRIFKTHGIKSVYLESDNITVGRYNKLLLKFNAEGISLITDETLSKTVSNLRLIKSEEEIAFINEAQKITEKAYKEVLNHIKPGVSERKISVELEYLMKKYGAEDISFDLITITGAKTSLPHGVPGDDIISSGDFFTLDIGSVYKGYHSDMTRTVAVKHCDDYKRKIYDIVLEAQAEALKKVKAGVKASAVDKTARDIINAAGYKKNFGHSTGHGVGLDIHELPFVSPKSETVLSENMVITVEPGIYLENEFGVRIEDMVLVRENGCKNFATLSKELIIV